MASENIDDFLEKVDEIYGQVKGLVTDTISIEEVDAKQKKLEEEKRKKDVAKQIKEEEERQKIVKGRSGKGQSEDYISFCRHCFVEYTLPTPQCAHCGKATLSKEDRHAELKLKVEDYKQKKAAKQERKDKWDKWRKTQAMYWKKTSTNYSKWDYFTSSEEEDNDNSEPILPKNDPNFMAMEKDLEERMKKREADKKAATKFKEEGNEYLTKRDYLKAIECYTLGMERMKDMKELYTNRALAYLKLGNYEKVVADCTSMLEFTEVFEKGYNQSATLCYKALIRRAQAYREMNKLDEAIQDTEEALKLVPADKDALRMKGEFQLAKEQQEKAKTFKQEPVEEAVEEDKQETPEPQTTQNGTSTVQGQKSTAINLNDAAACRKAIDELLDQENPSKEFIEKVVSVFKKNSDYKIYANEKGLAKKLVAWIKREDVERLIYLLVILFLQDNAVYIDQFFKNNGPSTLLKKLRTEAEAVQKGVEENKKTEFFQDLEEICEVFLNITENEKGRILLKDQPFLIEMLDAFYTLVLTNLRAQKEAATSYFSLLSNLAAISNKFAKYLENHYLDKMMEQLVESVFKKTKTSKYNRIKENLYGLIANLCRETSVRAKLLTMTPVIEAFHNCLLQSLDSFAILNVTNMKWIRSVENILAIFINLTFGVSEELHKKIFVEKFRLLEHVMRYLNLSIKRNEYVPVVLRTLQLLSKLDFQEFVLRDYKELILASFNEHFTQKAKELELTNHAIRVYVKWVSKSTESVLRKYLKPSDFDKLIEQLIVIVKEENEERFVNSTMLAGNIAEVFPECSSKFRECIPVLLNACKDKMGLWRKNAAICVAKLSKDPANLQAIRDLHGIEVLSSISRFVLEK